MDRDSQKNRNEASADPPVVGSVRLLDRYLAGDTQAATQLFDRYVTRLVALARSRMNSGMRRRLDPEDVVHSAYRSFFLRAAEGDFEFGESADLWRLLAQITLNKTRKQAERHMAARRDYRRDDAECVAGLTTEVEPSPDEAAALVEQVRLVTERLSADERIAFSAFLCGDSEDAIAGRFGRSPRTVRRVLSRVRSLIERQVLDGANPPSDCETPLENPLPYSDFRLERLIGAGGMGKVYRATQLSTGGSVAVKALRKDRQRDTRAVRQFLHEAAVVQRIRHPGVIRVHGLGRFPSGGYFIVMDYVEGNDLQTLVDRRAAPPDRGAAIVERVAEAVQCSHAAGVVHCDLKPANILLGPGGEVVVTDFGFAKIIAEGDSPAALGGTLVYLAPELLTGRGTPTPAADVYSLARILQRLGAGDQPQFQSVCHRCLSEDASARPQTAAEFLLLLRQASARERSDAAGHS